MSNKDNKNILFFTHTQYGKFVENIPVPFPSKISEDMHDHPMP